MNVPGSTRLLLIAAFLLSAAPGAPAAVSDAPLGVDTPGALRSLFLDLPLADARDAGSGRADVRYTVANGWSKPTQLVRRGRVAEVQLDAQTDALAAEVAVPWRAAFPDAPLAERVSTALSLRALVHWGGITDRPIEGWHHLARYWNFQRELFPRDAVRMRLGASGAAPMAALGGTRGGISDLALRTAIRLAEGGDAGGRPAWAIALRLDLKLPTGSPRALTGSGGADAGVGLAASGVLGRFTGHAMVQLRAVSGLPASSPLSPEPWQAGLDLSLVWRPSRRVALVLEDRVSTALFRGGWSLPHGEPEPEATAYYGLFRAHNQVSGGVRVGEVTWFFSEDFTPGLRLPTDPGPFWFYDSNAPDLVIGVAWARTF